MNIKIGRMLTLAALGVITLSDAHKLKSHSINNANSDQSTSNDDYKDAIALTSHEYQAPTDGDYVNLKMIEDQKLDQ